VGTDPEKEGSVDLALGKRWSYSLSSLGQGQGNRGVPWFAAGRKKKAGRTKNFVGGSSGWLQRRRRHRAKERARASRGSPGRSALGEAHRVHERKECLYCHKDGKRRISGSGGGSSRAGSCRIGGRKKEFSELSGGRHYQKAPACSAGEMTCSNKKSLVDLRVKGRGKERGSHSRGRSRRDRS